MLTCIDFALILQVLMYVRLFLVSNHCRGLSSKKAEDLIAIYCVLSDG